MENLQSEKDRMLWKQAKKRVGFKKHLYMYLVINVFFWLQWFFTAEREGGLPWPLFTSLGWGFGLFWHFIGAYVFTSKSSQIEKEFQRLKEKNL